MNEDNDELELVDFCDLLRRTMIRSNGKNMPFVLVMRQIGSGHSSGFLILFSYGMCQLGLILIQKTGHRLVNFQCSLIIGALAGLKSAVQSKKKLIRRGF